MFSTRLDNFVIFNKFEIVVCKLCQFGSLNFAVWERVKRCLQSQVILLHTHVSLVTYSCQCMNPLTDDKMLGLSKLKAFADDKSNVAQNI